MTIVGWVEQGNPSFTYRKDLVARLETKLAKGAHKKHNFRGTMQVNQRQTIYSVCTTNNLWNKVTQ